MALWESLRDHLQSIAPIKVYYQPPEDVRLEYPCGILTFTGIEKLNADNTTYKMHHRWNVLLILRNPDEEFYIVDAIGALPLCRFDRAYTADGLYHYNYVLYWDK